MKQTKRATSFLLIIVLIMVMIGCNKSGTDQPAAGQSGTASPTAGQNSGTGIAEKLTVTEFNWGWDGPVKEKDVIGPEIAKRLGMKELIMTHVKLGSYDDVLQKMQLWSSTGGSDWPDFLMTGADSRTQLLLNNMGESGQLMDLTPWLDKYPNVKQALDKLIPFSKNPNDGKIYFIPQNWSDPKAIPLDLPPVWIRKDWLDQLKLPYPKTVDEFHQTLKAMKEKIPPANGQEIIPYLAFGDGGDMISLFYPEGKAGWYTDDNGLAAYGFISMPEYLINALTFYNELYHEGLLAKESMSLKQGQIDEMASQGRSGAVHGMSWQVNPYTDAIKSGNSDAIFTGIPLYDPRVAPGYTLPKFKLEAYSYWTVKAGVSDEEVNSFFKILDFCLTEEGTILNKFGIKDVHWQRNKDGKIEDNPKFLEATQGDWNKRAHYGIDIYTLMTSFDAIVKNMAPTGIELRKDMQITWENLGAKYPSVFVSDPQSYIFAGEVQNQKWIGFEEQYKQMVAKAITASSTDKIKGIVEDLRNTLMSSGYEEIVKERTEAAKKVDVSRFNS